MVCLVGKPAELGERLGRILAPFIRSRVEEHIRDRKSLGNATQDRREAFLSLLEGEAPHWLEESRAMAHAAEVDISVLLELNCAVQLTTRASCTSVLVMGDRAAGGIPMLLKIRDEWPQHQAMGYRRLEGCHGILFGTDPSNLGLGQGCNEFGLVVANNSGGLVPEPAGPVGFNDCQTTRLLLERARNVDEALDAFKALMDQGKIGLVDDTRGIIFLMVDRRGKGLIIETTRDQYETLAMDGGWEVRSNHWILEGSKRFAKEIAADHPLMLSSRLRYERSRELLDGKEKISLSDLEALSRDGANAPYSICNGSTAFPWRTVSSFIYRPDPALRLPVRVSAGLPSREPYKNVPWWQRETPLEYLLTWNG